MSSRPATEQMPAGTQTATESAAAMDASRYAQIRRVTLAGSLVDLLLGVVKIAIGIVGQSQALIADGVHSLSDLVTDFMVLFAAKHASRAADEQHPYGHGRIETVMTVALGITLAVVAAGIGYDALRRMFNPELLLNPGWLALLAAGLSVAAKEGIYHYTIRVARRLRSKLLRANAWHSRTDAISSIIVVIGVLGTMAGLDYLDAVAAVGVALMIAKIGWDLSWDSMRELIDTGLESDRLAAIRRAILSVEGVQTLHMLRTRQMSGAALVDVHILVDPKLSVSEGHQISENVRSKLINDIDEVSDVTVHIDPEDDERAPPCRGLPSRAVVVERLQQLWPEDIAHRGWDGLTLHYLDGKIHVELRLPLDVVGDLAQARQLAARLQRAAQEEDFIGSIQVSFH